MSDTINARIIKTIESFQFMLDTMEETLNEQEVILLATRKILEQELIHKKSIASALLDTRDMLSSLLVDLKECKCSMATGKIVDAIGFIGNTLGDG